jgi:predicted HTH transcriptional regulator
MVEGASGIYCRPEVRFSVREWQVDGRKVLEVIIEQGEQKPYMAQEPEGTWAAYVRQGDQNFKAPALILKVWERQQSGKGTTIYFRNPESTLLRYLEINESITLSKFRRLAGLSALQAEMILADFIVLGLLKVEFTGQGMHFRLVTDYRRIIRSMKKEEL